MCTREVQGDVRQDSRSEGTSGGTRVCAIEEHCVGVCAVQEQKVMCSRRHYGVGIRRHMVMDIWDTG